MRSDLKLLGRNGDVVLQLTPLELDHDLFSRTSCLSYYTIALLENFEGELVVEHSHYRLSGNLLVSVQPFQPFHIRSVRALTGNCLRFHPSFFCIYRHEAETCDDVVFNNIFLPPFIEIASQQLESFRATVSAMRIELQEPGHGHWELLASYLGLLLIEASRLKSDNLSDKGAWEGKDGFLAMRLRQMVDENFRHTRSSASYADMLNVSVKMLWRVTRKYFNRSLSSLIGARVMAEARRELYLTDKPIKQIAIELGFFDEHYFSRYFKNLASVSPEEYRAQITDSTSH
jgi:AraC family transcriptional activator of pobA